MSTFFDNFLLRLQIPILVGGTLCGLATATMAALPTYEFVAGAAPGAVMPGHPETGYAEAPDGRRLHEFAGMNDYGTVIGQVAAPTAGPIKSNAAKWKNGVLTNLGTVGCEAGVTECSARALAVNNFDMVVGASNTLGRSAVYWGANPLSFYHEHQVRWVNTDWSMLRGNGFESGWGKDVNNESVTVGSGRSTFGFSVDYLTHGFVEAQGTTIELGTYNQKTVANSINETKTVAGAATFANKWQAFQWVYGGSLVNLGDLGGGWSEGIDINESGWIAGDSTLSEGAMRGFLYKESTMSVLNPLSDHSVSRARAINDTGWVVGFSDTDASTINKRAVIWEAGTAYDLNKLVSSEAGKSLPSGTIVQDAVDINRFGDILVIVDSNGTKSYATLRNPAASRDSQPTFSPGTLKANYQYSLGGTDFDKPHAVATDRTGNVFVVGSFKSRSVDFDPTSGTDIRDAGDPSSYSRPYLPPYFSKINFDGTYGWTKTFIHSTHIYSPTQRPDLGILDIEADSQNNVYLYGRMINGCVKFDAAQADSEICVDYPGDLHSAFLVKYDSGGNFVRVQRWQVPRTTDRLIARAMAIGPDDAVYLAGSYDVWSGGLDFDPTAGTDKRTGSKRGFLTRLNADGSYGWTRETIPTNNTWYSAYPDNIVVTPIGDIFITGTLFGAANVNSLGDAILKDTTSNGWAAFVAKFNKGGVFALGKAIDFTVGQNGYTVASASDAVGGLYLVIPYYDNNYNQAYRLDGNGNTMAGWPINPAGSLTYGGSIRIMSNTLGEVYRTPIAHDPQGDLYLVGSYENTLDFDRSSTGTDYKQSFAYRDAFVTIYSPSGAYHSTVTFGGSGYDLTPQVAVDKAGTISVAGTFDADQFDYDRTDGLGSLTAKKWDDTYLLKFTKK